MIFILFLLSVIQVAQKNIRLMRIINIWKNTEVKIGHKTDTFAADFDKRSTLFVFGSGRRGYQKTVEGIMLSTVGSYDFQVVCVLYFSSHN